MVTNDISSTGQQKIPFSAGNTQLTRGVINIKIAAAHQSHAPWDLSEPPVYYINQWQAGCARQTPGDSHMNG